MKEFKWPFVVFSVAVTEAGTCGIRRLRGKGLSNRDGSLAVARIPEPSPEVARPYSSSSTGSAPTPRVRELILAASYSAKPSVWAKVSAVSTCSRRLAG